MFHIKINAILPYSHETLFSLFWKLIDSLINSLFQFFQKSPQLLSLKKIGDS